MGTEQTVAKLLQNYLGALHSRNIDVIDQLFGSNTLLEIPLLKPNRLHGNVEIVKAHREIFSNLETVDFSLSDTLSSDSHAIAEGRLQFSRFGGDSKSLAAGIVAEAADENLVRISLYCDSRNLRLWSDKTIM